MHVTSPGKQWLLYFQPLHWSHTIQSFLTCPWASWPTTPPPEPGECLQVIKSVCQLYKKVYGFPAAFRFTSTGRQSSLSFTARKWELLFLVQDPWAGEPGVRLRSLALQGKPPSPRYPSQCSTTICGSKNSKFCASTPSTTLDVASSLYPYLEDLCSFTLQMVLKANSYIIYL